ncbi:MAG: septum formation family protein [Pauljensenia sp.]
MDVRAVGARPRGRGRALVPLAVLALVPLGLGACSSTSVLSLETGQCLDAPSGETVTDVELRSCTSAHSLEVVGTFDLDGDTLPAEDDLTATAQDRCSQAFADYVGIDVEESGLDLTWLAPTTQSWNASGDRTVACLAGADTDSLTSSVKGSRR